MTQPTWEETDQDHIWEQLHSGSRLKRTVHAIATWKNEISWFLIGSVWGHILTHNHWIGF